MVPGTLLLLDDTGKTKFQAAMGPHPQVLQAPRGKIYVQQWDDCDWLSCGLRTASQWLLLCAVAACNAHDMV
jgi:hypothetical protein